MRYKHYNQHLYKGSKRFLNVVFLTALFSCFLYPIRPGKVRHIHIFEGMSVSIPKSSMLIAALKDSSEKDFHINVAEFEALNQLPSEPLESDRTYIRPRVINIDQGISLSKSQFILGKVKYIDPKKSSFVIRKEEAKKLMKVQSTENIAMSDEDPDANWYEMVKREEKLAIIQGLKASSNPSNFNRLAALSYDDLQDIKYSYSPEQDPVISEIRQRIESAFDEREAKKDNNSNITIVSHNQTRTSDPYGWQSNFIEASINKDEASKKPAATPPPQRKPIVGGLANALAQSGINTENINATATNASSLGLYASTEETNYQTSGYSFESINIVKEKHRDPRDVRLSGAIEFTDGLAYLGPQSELKVFHVDDKGNKKLASIDWSRAEYLVDIVEGLNLVVAEYRDSAGQLLGYFESKVKTGLEKLKQKVVLKPVSWGLRIDWVNYVKDKTWKLWIDGKELIQMHGQSFISESWTSYSNFSITLEAEKIQSQNQIISAKQASKITTVSTEYFDAIRELLYEQGQYVDKQLGVVIGEIKSDTNQSGFRAEITDSQAIGPIYFNDFFIPNLQLKESSHSGMFMFVNVSPGNHQVRLRSNELVSSSIGLISEKTISKFEFDLNNTKTLKLSAIDYETALSQETVFQISGTEDLFQSKAMKEVELVYLENKALNSIEFYSGEDYLPTRWNFTDRKSLRVAKKLPVVSKKLIQENFDIEKPILHLNLNANISDLFINHLRLDLENLNLKAYRLGFGFEDFEPGKLNSYDSVFIQGLNPGIHSVQFELQQGLMSSGLVVLTDNFVSLVEP